MNKKRSLLSEIEICRLYSNAVSKVDEIQILSDISTLSESDIIMILMENGYDIELGCSYTGHNKSIRNNLTKIIDNKTEEIFNSELDIDKKIEEMVINQRSILIHDNPYLYKLLSDKYGIKDPIKHKCSSRYIFSPTYKGEEESNIREHVRKPVGVKQSIYIRYSHLFPDIKDKQKLKEAIYLYIVEKLENKKGMNQSEIAMELGMPVQTLNTIRSRLIEHGEYDKYVKQLKEENKI